MISQTEKVHAEPEKLDKDHYVEKVLPKIEKICDDLGIEDRQTRNFYRETLPDIVWGEGPVALSVEMTIDGQDFIMPAGERKFLDPEDIPILRIRNLDAFTNALVQYAETMKHLSYIRYTQPEFFTLLLISLGDADLDNPVRFIERSAQILRSKQFEDLNEIRGFGEIPSLKTKIWAQQVTAPPGYESPAYLEIIFSDEKPDPGEVEPGTLPVVRFAITEENKTGYIYSLQDMTRDSGADWANKRSLDSQVFLFEEGATELRNMVVGLHDKYPDLMVNLFGPIRKSVLGQQNNPRNFVLALHEYLQEENPDLGTKYLDTKDFAALGITTEIARELRINGNSILFSNFCKRRDDEIQESLKQRSFRKKIDRKLMSITKDCWEHETDEAKQYLQSAQEIRGKYNKLIADAKNKYEKSEKTESERIEKVEALISLEKRQAEELTEIEPVENISEVTPSAMVSLLVCLTEMQKRGVFDIKATVNMPLRWQNHLVASRRAGEINLDKYINIHHNITEKFVRTFRALAAHIPGIEIISLPDSPEMPLELKLDPTKWESKQPILQEVIEAIKS